MSAAARGGGRTTRNLRLGDTRGSIDPPSSWAGPQALHLDGLIGLGTILQAGCCGPRHIVSRGAELRSPKIYTPFGRSG